MAWRENPRSTDASLTPEPAYARAARSSWISGRRRAPDWARHLTGETAVLLWLIPLLVAAAYLVIFVVQLPRNVTEIAWNSDYASGFTMPETLVHTGTAGNTVISSSGQWVSLWFGLLTAGLPLHRELWYVAPTLLFVASALAVGWSVSQIADRRAGLLAVMLCLVASPLALAFFMAAVAHNTVYPCTALLGAYLIWLARAEHRSRVLSLAVPPIVGVAVGVCLASDLLLAVTAVIPLGVTALVTGVRRERRSRLLAVSALATIAVAVPVARLTSSIMRSDGFLTVPTPAKAVPLAELPERATLLFKGLKALFNGYLGSSTAPGTLHPALGVASTVVMSVALLALLVLGALAATRLLVSGIRQGASQTPSELARSLHVTYWVTSAATACGAFWIAAETGGGTNLHESYYATIVFSVAAVIPLLLSRGLLARVAVAAGATIFFVASLVGLTSNYTNISPWIAEAAPTVERIAAANHVTVGYGGYGEASSLTWNTDGRVVVRPLMECPNPSGAPICPFYMSSVPAWFVPQQRHTFLLVDEGEGWVGSLPQGLGKPLATYRFKTMSMYIYPYDIASRLGPQQD
jgi:hypothetical protein